MADIAPDRQGLLPAGENLIHWEYFGKGEKEPIALLNGLAMHCKAWYGFLPFVLPQHDVILYDYLGQGESSAPDEPVLIPSLAGFLVAILDELKVQKTHVMGISYGGFVALEFARLHQERLHTLTLSGILLSNEELFEMYEALSLRFYRGGPEVFEIYTHYMYEKIFGEAFVRKVKDNLDTMRRKFHDRYKDSLHALIRLTEAQDPFFAALEENMPGYREIRTPALVMPGEEDRAIPPWVQKKIVGILPDARWEPIAESGHVVYLERPDVFFPMLLRFTAAKSTVF
ncbi:MAG: alpha/beta hydrolase [Thermoanaerobaculia bacterium]|nr:2-hydroxy-6-oxononadienedioate/2-hydroxy-6-oxononatrienedioate hydrolase [Thermoanaerobaculia bacterium]MCK6684440.1 alpha/beta hydrolase [Thermoanaerobaculia bacterium]